MKIWFYLTLFTLIVLTFTSVYAADFIIPVQNESDNIYTTQTPCVAPYRTGEDRSHCDFYLLDREAWDIGCGGYEGCGTVMAVAGGEVIGVKDNSASKIGYGNYVRIRHANGLVSLYGHLQRGTVKVSKGDYVTQGQILGMVGKSGNSEGAHLHFSLSKNGVPYSSTGLINFDQLPDKAGGGIIGFFKSVFNSRVEKVKVPTEPLKPIDLKPIGDMVARFYNWALNIGVAVSTGIVIWGGVLYISAADDPSKSKEAKKWVMAAIYGLLLLFTAYLILYTINPCLVGTGSGCA